MEKTKKARRKKRVRAKIFGTKDCPRLSVYRSNRYIGVQLINDEKSETILGLHEKSLSGLKDLNKTERAAKLGKELAKQAQKKGIEQVVFDRGGYRFHGRIKALAEAAREGGLSF